MNMSFLSSLTEQKHASQLPMTPGKQTSQDDTFADLFHEQADGVGTESQTQDALKTEDSEEAPSIPLIGTEVNPTEQPKDVLPEKKGISQAMSELEAAPVPQDSPSEFPSHLTDARGWADPAARKAITAEETRSLQTPGALDRANERPASQPSQTMNAGAENATVSADSTEAKHALSGAPVLRAADTKGNPTSAAVVGKVGLQAPQEAEQAESILAPKGLQSGQTVVANTPASTHRPDQANMHVVMRPIEQELEPDSFRGKDVEASVRTVEAKSLSTLDRHLGGHAATLITTAVPTHPRATSIVEAVRFKGKADAEFRAVTPTTHPMSDTSHGRTVQMIPSMAPLSAASASGIALSLHTQKGDASKVLDTNVMDEVGWDTRVTLPVTGAGPASSVPRNDLATNVIQQIADAIRQSPDRPVEIALNPVELGRVRMILSATDAGITVSILADRPETLDLMRRNIDDLGKSFLDMGYEDISFSFGQNDHPAEQENQHLTDLVEDTRIGVDVPDQPTIPIRQTPALAIAPDGIDMRL